MKKVLLLILTMLPLAVMAQTVTYTIGATATNPTVWSNVVAGKWYKFNHANTTVATLTNKHVSSDGTNMLGVEDALDEASVWTLESVAGGYKIKNLKGEYLTNFGLTSPQYLVGVSTDESAGVVFTLSLGNANANNCLFTVTTPPAAGYAYLHFDTGVDFKGFFHNANGVNSQFRLYEVEVTETVSGGELSEEYRQKLEAVTAAYAKMVAPGEFVRATGNYFVTTEQKAVVNQAITDETVEAIDAAEAVIATLTEQDGICDDNLYLINNNTALNSGTIFVNSENIIRGTVAGTAAVTGDREKWMIVAVDGVDTYILYNVGTDRVANCDMVAASNVGSGPDDAWTALNTFDVFDRGYVVIESMNPTQWRIRDSQVEGLTDANKNTLRCYMNNDGASSGKVTVWQQNGTPTGNANSLFNLCYLGKATVDHQSAVSAMRHAIEHPKVQIPVSSVRVATMHYADRNLVVPANLSAWTFSCDGNYIIANKSYVEDGIIPAGTAVLLQECTEHDGEASTVYDFMLTRDEGTAPASNLLKGGAVNDLSRTYILSIGDAGVGFYKAPSGFVNGDHKAFLELPEDVAGHVQILAFDQLLGGETHIATAASSLSRDICHDLSGRRIARPTTGLYIKNGQKYMVK